MTDASNAPATAPYAPAADCTAIVDVVLHKLFIAELGYAIDKLLFAQVKQIFQRHFCDWCYYLRVCDREFVIYGKNVVRREMLCWVLYFTSSYYTYT